MRTGAFCGRGGQISWRTYLRWPQVFLEGNLRKCPVQLKERAYITFVRSTLDYASPIWDPFLKRDMNNLEKINRRAARFVTGDYHPISSISSMLHSLGWFDLKDRRRDTQLALLFKIVNGDVVVVGGRPPSRASWPENQIKSSQPIQTQRSVHTRTPELFFTIALWVSGTRFLPL